MKSISYQKAIVSYRLEGDFKGLKEYLHDLRQNVNDWEVGLLEKGAILRDLQLCGLPSTDDTISGLQDSISNYNILIEEAKEAVDIIEQILSNNE